MRFIGITGGVGAGKSEILSYLAGKPDARVLLADEIAHELMEPGTDVYDRICREFSGEDLFEDGGAGEAPPQFDRRKMARIIFSDKDKRNAMNGIVHPAVRQYVCKTAAEERRRGQLKLLVLEAALLIEEHYDEICDELWYIYTRESVRKQRLMASRGYSEEKVRQIFASQLTDMEYRSHCSAVIDNNGTVEEACRQIDARLWELFQTL